jgi:glyoxylase-like metal-dependent hydrolase (beta-lactamase superfamily II)
MRIQTVVVGPFEANCCILWRNGGPALVIDPGSEPDAIRAALDRERLSVGAYLLTHGHVDHVSALEELHSWQPAPIRIHADDLPWTFTEENAMPPFYPAPRSPASELDPLSGDASLQEAGIEYRVVATPGHTPGSVCFFFPDPGILVSGDTLFAGSVGRTDLPGGSVRALRRSLDRLAQFPDDTCVYPGHGPQTTIRAEKETNMFLRQPFDLSFV